MAMTLPVLCNLSAHPGRPLFASIRLIDKECEYKRIASATVRQVLLFIFSQRSKVEAG